MYLTHKNKRYMLPPPRVTDFVLKTKQREERPPGGRASTVKEVGDALRLGRDTWLNSRLNNCKNNHGVAPPPPMCMLFLYIYIT